MFNLSLIQPAPPLESPIVVIYYEKNPASFGLKIGHLGFREIHRETTGFQEILIGETARYGRALFLDGVIQSSQADEAIYHDMLIHPVMAHTRNGRRILVAGAGEGASMRELLKHTTVKTIDAVEIDGGMIGAAKAHLPSWHQGAWDDSRVSVIEADIFDHLAKPSANNYDAIIIDLTDPIDDAGDFCADSLTFKPAFLDAAQAALAPGGCIVMQVGERLPGLKGVLANLRNRFKWVQPYSVFVPSFHSNWTFFMMSNEDRRHSAEAIHAKLTALEALGTPYFSCLAYQLAAEQADRFFQDISET